MRTLALPISLSIPPIRRRFMRCCGLHALRPGKFAAADRSTSRGAGFSNPPMAEAPGTCSQRDCPLPLRISAAWASRLLLRNPIASTPASKPSAESPAFIALTMPANPGSKLVATAASEAAVRARWASPSRRTIRKSFTWRTPRRGNPRTAEKHL